jgi:superkiller protein 3
MGTFKTDEEIRQELLKKAIDYADKNEFEMSVREFENILKQSPGDEDALFNIGFVLLEIKQYGPAYDIFSKLINTDPHHAAAFDNLGLLFARLGKTDDAVFVYKKGIEHNPQSAMLCNNLGNVYYNSGNFEQALMLFKRSGELDPVYTQRLRRLGIESFIKGTGESADEAVKELRRYYDSRAGAAKSLQDLGIAYMEHRMFRRAVEYFNKAVMTDPECLNAYAGLGRIYEQLEKYDSAINAYKKALALDPGNAKIYNILGILYDRAGQPDTALKMYKHAATLDPDYAESHYILGKLYQDKGIMDKAEAEFMKHVRIMDHGASVDDAIKRIAGITGTSAGDVRSTLNLNNSGNDADDNSPVIPETLRQEPDAAFEPADTLPSSSGMTQPEGPVVISPFVMELLRQTGADNVIELPARPVADLWQKPQEAIETSAANAGYKHTQETAAQPRFDTGTPPPENPAGAAVKAVEKNTSADNTQGFKKHLHKNLPNMHTDTIHSGGVYSVGSIAPIGSSTAVPLSPHMPDIPPAVRTKNKHTKPSSSKNGQD